MVLGFRRIELQVVHKQPIGEAFTRTRTVSPHPQRILPNGIITRRSRKQRLKPLSLTTARLPLAPLAPIAGAAIVDAVHMEGKLNGLAGAAGDSDEPENTGAFIHPQALPYDVWRVYDFLARRVLVLLQYTCPDVLPSGAAELELLVVECGKGERCQISV